jgi:photosystem II stability/assembly factor-like uncharacterized protein
LFYSSVFASNLGTWDFLGPDNLGGKIQALVIDPSDPSTFYAATSGGVWKTTDDGASWTPVSDSFLSQTTTCLAMDPSNPAVLYSCTGAGIYKTTNSGANWTLLPTNSSVFPSITAFNDLIISPNNSQRLYLASNLGVEKSNDGGNTWSIAIDNVDEFEGCFDLTMRTDQASDYVFASCGATNVTIYRNTAADGGGTWKKVLATDGKTAISLAPSNQAIIYAAATNSSLSSTFFTGLGVIWRSTDAGDNWTPMYTNLGSTTMLSNMLMSNPYLALCQGASNRVVNTGFANLTVAVDPVNSNRVWVGSTDLFRSTDGGATWGLASNWIDPQNAHFANFGMNGIVFHPDYDGNVVRKIYAATGGGVFRSDDALAATASDPTAPAICDPNNIGITWNALNNGLAATRFQQGAMVPSVDAYLAASPDQGLLSGSDVAGDSGWTRILNQDLRSVLIDPLNANTVYVAGTGITLQKSTNGGGSFVPAVSGITDANLGAAPYAMDPANSQRLWTGGKFPWRSTDGAQTWVRASSTTDKDIQAIAISDVNPGHVIVGRASGKMHYTNNGLTTTSTSAWTALASPRKGSQEFISSLTFQPGSDSIVYVTFASRSSASNVPVWKSTNSGSNWADASGAGGGKLPDIFVYYLVVNPDNPAILYVGTERGVYSTTNGGSSWAQENNGLAVAVRSLKYVAIGNSVYLYAFTSGRGAWRVLLGTITPPTVSLTAPADLATVTDVIIVSADADDDTGVDHVDFYLDGVTKIGTDSTDPYDINWDTKTTSNGSHSLTAKATDLDGHSTTSSPRTVTVDNPIVPPTVSLTAPADLATVLGVIIVSADADDDTGVDHVEFYLDDVTNIGTDSSFPYEINWDTKTTSNGSHSLTANAYDLGSTSTTSSPRTVTVDNPASLFLDEFDNAVVAPWIPVKGTWTESGGELQVITSSKAIIDAPPAASCGTCHISTDFKIVTAGGTVWIYGWYKDSSNYVRADLNDAKNTVTFFQKVNGTTLWKISTAYTLNANQQYNVVLSYASGTLTLDIGGATVLSHSTGSVPSATGKIRYTVKAASVSGSKVATTFRFQRIEVLP